MDVEQLEHLKDGLEEENRDLNDLYDSDKERLDLGIGSDDEEEEPRIVVLRLRKYLEKIGAALRGEKDDFDSSSDDA